MTATYRRPRRRRRGWIALLVVLLVLLGLAVVADRVAVHVAANQVAQRLEGHDPFTARPHVQIHGFPFLTQAVGGRYSDIEVAGDHLRLGRLDGVRADAHLRGVHLPLSALRTGITQVPVDRADVSLTVPWASLAAASGIPGLTLSAAGSQVRVRARVDVPVLGAIEADATGRVAGSNNTISVQIDSVQGAAIPDLAKSAIGKALSFQIPLTALPYQAELESVRSRSDGLRIDGLARDLVLRDPNR